MAGWTIWNTPCPSSRNVGVPAVLFIATDYVGTERCFWQETLARYLAAAATVPERARRCSASWAFLTFSSLPPAEARAATRAMIDSLKSQPQAQLDALLRPRARFVTTMAGELPQNHPDRFLLLGTGEAAQRQRRGDHRVTLLLAHAADQARAPTRCARNCNGRDESSRSASASTHAIWPTQMAITMPNIAAAVSAAVIAPAFTTNRGTRGARGQCVHPEKNQHPRAGHGNAGRVPGASRRNFSNGSNTRYRRRQSLRARCDSLAGRARAYRVHGIRIASFAGLGIETFGRVRRLQQSAIARLISSCRTSPRSPRVGRSMCCCR